MREIWWQFLRGVCWGVGLGEIVTFMVSLFVASMVYFVIVLFLGGYGIQVASCVMSSVMCILVLYGSYCGNLDVNEEVAGVRMFSDGAVGMTDPIGYILHGCFCTLRLLRIFFMLFASSKLQVNSHVAKAGITREGVGLGRMSLEGVILTMDKIVTVVLLVKIVVCVETSDLKHVSL